jgi:hypothetical protein
VPRFTASLRRVGDLWLCKGCDQALPAGDFTVDRRAGTPRPRCKPCQATWNREKYWSTPAVRTNQIARTRRDRGIPVSVEEIRKRVIAEIEPECARTFGCLNCPYEVCVHDLEEDEDGV